MYLRRNKTIGTPPVPPRGASVSLVAIALASALGCSADSPAEAVGSTSEPLLGDGIVISQVFGGGGNSGATLNEDFVELFNTSSAPVSLAGLSLQYGSATGQFANPTSDGGVGTELTVLPAVTVPAGGYYLVGMASTNTSVGAALPATDFVGPSDLSATNGKIALARITTTLGCGTATNLCAATDLVDLVGYGTASDFEGSAATAALSASKSAARNGGGCTNTESNSADFTVGAPAPRNSSTAIHLCEGADAGDGGTIAFGPDAADSSSNDGATSDDATNEDGAVLGDAGEGDDGTAGGASSIDGAAPDGASADAGTSDDAGGADSGVGGFTGLVISQVFGGGGNNGAPYDADFVELFNRSSASLPLAGLSLQYGSKAGAFGAPLADGGPGGNLFVLPAATLAPGHYFLVGLDSSSTTGAALPTVDATGTLSLSSTDGKVALASVTTSLDCGTATNLCPQTNLVDLVGYGAADDFEGSAAVGVLSNTKAALRLGAGCVDTRNNVADFAVGTPAPRNGATAPVDCATQSDDAGIGIGGGDAGPGGDMDAGGNATDASEALDDDAGIVVSGDDAGVTAVGNGPGDDAGTIGATGGGSNGFVAAGSSGCSCRTAGAKPDGSGPTGLFALSLLGTLLPSRRRARRSGR